RGRGRAYRSSAVTSPSRSAWPPRGSTSEAPQTLHATFVAALLKTICSFSQSLHLTFTNFVTPPRISGCLLELELLGPLRRRLVRLLADLAAVAERDALRGLLAALGLGAGKAAVTRRHAAEPALSLLEFAGLALLDALDFLHRVLLALGAVARDRSRAEHSMTLPPGDDACSGRGDRSPEGLQRFLAAADPEGRGRECAKTSCPINGFAGAVVRRRGPRGAGPRSIGAVRPPSSPRRGPPTKGPSCTGLRGCA